MSEKREKALMLIKQMLPTEWSSAFHEAEKSETFAGEIGELALNNVFAELWLRPGLDRRSRSLVTLGILIALRAADELEIHFAIAEKNGISLSEIEEVIYHATGYAGFPAANSARAVAIRALRRAKLID